MSIEAFGEHSPKIGQDVFIHPNSTLIGQVTLGDRVSIWPNVTLRGDEGQIIIGEDTNIQDGSVIHMTGGYSHTYIGARTTVGHLCLLHGCTIEDDCLIGMGTVLLDQCVIGTGSYIAAGTLIAGRKKIPPYSFVRGRPGSLDIRPLPDQRRQEMDYSWRHYVKVQSQYRAQGTGIPK
jgi:carbonic anhydrase/acetyltransferase-like protein (isoleucine patch superfamily)